MKIFALFRSLSAWLLVAAIPTTYANSEQTTATWTGAEDNLASKTTNWASGTLPANDGTANLAFNNTTGSSAITFSGNLNVKGLLFNGANRSWQIGNEVSGSNILLGTNGIAVADGATSCNFVSIFSPTDTPLTLTLAGNQTWSTGANTWLWVESPIIGAYDIIKTGSGTLELYGNNSGFTGSLNINAGSLNILQSMSLGTGTVSLGVGSEDQASLWVSNSDETIANNLQLGSNVQIGTGNKQTIISTGKITLTASKTNLDLSGRYFWNTGGLAASNADSTLIVNGTTALVLEGTTEANVSALTANESAIIFAQQRALGSAKLLAVNGGYLGAGYAGGGKDIVSSINDKPNFYGTIGFDSNPKDSAITVFNDELDLSGFTEGQVALGSFSRGILSATSNIILGQNATAYRFGGGDGLLFVQTALGGAYNVEVGPIHYLQPLQTVIFQGNNTFTGNLTSTRSIAILDSATALPASSKLVLGYDGYIGHTENWSKGGQNNFSAADFLGRFDSTNSSETAIIGFDSANTSTPRTLSDDLDFSSETYTNWMPYIGTATAITLDGKITPNGDRPLALTGVKGGKLTINSTINGATSLVIGYNRTNLGDDGIVTLNGANTYTGGTELRTGTLVVGHNQALGTGTLYTSESSSDQPWLVSRSDITLENNISLYRDLRIGLYSAGEPGSTASLDLKGSVSGIGAIDVNGLGTLTLSGDNSISNSLSLNDQATLNLASDTATGTSAVYINNGNTINASTIAPVIDSIHSGCSDAKINLASESTLTLTQGGEFAGSITGDANLVVGNGTDTANLYLQGSSNNTYTGTTTIKQHAAVKAASSQALGTGGVILDGGKLWNCGSRVVNPITFGTSGRGTLGGSGTYAATGITIGKNARLSPGLEFVSYYAPIGTLNFEQSLTLAGGGIYDVQIRHAVCSPGTGWDNVTITGSLLFDSSLCACTPFTIAVGTLDGSDNAGLLSSWDPNGSYSWQIFSTTDLITGFDASLFAIDTTNFQSPTAGSFSLSLGSDNTSLYLNYLPAAVPEPSTWMLMFTGAAAVVFPILRRRRK